MQDREWSRPWSTCGSPITLVARKKERKILLRSDHARDQGWPINSFLLHTRAGGEVLGKVITPVILGKKKGRNYSGMITPDHHARDHGMKPPSRPWHHLWPLLRVFLFLLFLIMPMITFEGMITTLFTAVISVLFPPCFFFQMLFTSYFVIYPYNISIYACICVIQRSFINYMYFRVSLMSVFFNKVCVQSLEFENEWFFPFS